MIFIMIILIVLFLVGNSANAKHFINKDECKMHKWEYDDTGFLICSVCKNRPGYAGRDQ